MRELFGGQTKISDNQEQAQLRSELRKYLLTQIINRDFYIRSILVHIILVEQVRQELLRYMV
jgi:outer membrane lipopolysaccharide assembly protein LptE/RlpB